MGVIRRFLFYGILAIMLFLSLKSAFAIQVELLESTDQCISCYSIYKITNDKSITPLSVDESTMWFEFRKPETELSHAREIDTLRNWNVEIQDERLKEWTEQVLTDEGCTSKDVVYPNGTVKETTCNPKYTTINHQETEKYWKPFENKALDNSKELIIKVSGNIKVNSAIDNVLVLKDETNTFTKYTQYAWWNSSWQSCRVINITNPVATVLTQFPVPLKFNGTLFANASFENGTDLRFVDATDCNSAGTELNYSIYYFNKSDAVRQSVIMVQDSIGASATKQVAVYYNNSGATATTTNAFNQNYITVQALCNLNDKTSYGINGSLVDAPFKNISSSSPVTCAYQFDGSNDAITFTNNLLNFNGNLTIEFWFKSVGTADNKWPVSKNPSATFVDWGIQTYPSTSKLNLYADTSATTPWDTEILGSHTYDTTNWYHISARFITTTGANLFKNGVSLGTDASASSGVNSNVVAIGYGQAGGGFFSGHIADFRISNTTRGNQWINASYQNWTVSFDAEQGSGVASAISYVVNYSTPVYELSNQSFWINLSWNGNISGVVATNLEYNNTNYSMSLLDNGSDWVRYNTSIIIPLTAGISLADENRTFKFFYNYTNSSGTFTENTTESIQRVMEAYFINSVSTTTNIPELSNATLVVNISQVQTYDWLNWSIVLEFNGTNYTITNNTLNNETFNYTEFIGVVLTNNTRINHTAYLNLNWNGINASRSGFNPYNILLQNYFPITSTNGNISEGSTSITTVNIQNISGAFTTSTSPFNVSVIWNGTSYQATQLNTTAWQLNHTAPIVYNITNFTITGVLNVSYAGVSSLRNYSVGQYVYPFGLDNCSTYTVMALNFSLFDEVSLASINGTLAGFFNVTNTGKTFNISWASNTSFGLCISPNDANISVMSQAEYASPGYVTRTYYMYNTTLDNATDQVSLYLNTNASLVVLAVSDQDDSAVQDVYIYVQAYDITTNSFKTVQVVKTDFRGQAYPALTLYTQWYKFLLVYQGNTVLETDATKLLTSTLNFRISLVEDELASFTASHDVACNVSWNNATQNFEFVFVNPESTDVTALLEVLKQDVYSSTTINSSTLTASSGTIIVGIGSMENKTYVGKGTIDGYICGTPASTSFGGSWQTTGSNGLLLAVLLLVAIVCIMSWSPTISIIALLVGVVLAFMMGILYMSWIPFISFLIIGGIAVYRLARGSSSV